MKWKKTKMSKIWYENKLLEEYKKESGRQIPRK